MHSDIAIIGGGFAGTLLGIHLAAKTPRPLRITLYDRNAAFARGVAYGTDNPSHLLNVVAGRMGAFPGKVEDFHRWLQERGYTADATEFMPRKVYGAYIESLWKEAQGRPGKVTFTTVAQEVTDVSPHEGGLTLTLPDGTTHNTFKLALALGSLPTQPPRFAKPLTHPERYTGNVWAPAKGSLLSRLDLSQERGTVLIIGTGLTTIDMIATLRDRHFQGKIIAVSRNGLLPQPHAPVTHAFPRFLSPESAPCTALELLHAVRKETKTHDWRAVLDSLRADTPALWAQLPEQERKKLLRVLSFWNVHRHRMPPQSVTMVEREVQAGRLSIIAASIGKIEETDERFIIHVRRKRHQVSGTEALHANHILNCAGPITDISRSGHMLLLNLLKKKLLRQGPLGMGIAAQEDGNVKGEAQGRIFALGPLLIGERLETVAVPELRIQAETVAQSLLTTVSA